MLSIKLVFVGRILLEISQFYQKSRTTTIIIHTMSINNNINLRNFPLSDNPLPNHSLTSSLFSELALQAAYLKHQLSQALTINSSLIHRAQKYEDLPTIQNILQKSITQAKTQVPFPAEIPFTSDVKIEHSNLSPPSIQDSFKAPAKRKGKQRRLPQPQAEDDQDQDKNQTKNIPKNYGKAMLSFIQKNIRKYSDLIKPILNASNLTVMDLLLSVRRHKKEVNSINYLKLIWGHVDKSDPIFKCIRILSYVFMRKHCLEYIFNSRIKNYSTHIKYRKRIMEGIQNTTEFTCIKQF